MLEALGKLLATWFGSPIRGLAVIMLSAIIVIALWQFQPVREVAKDPFLRWVFLALIVSASGLVTYPVGYGWKRLEAKRNKATASKKIIERLSDLTPHEKHVLRKYLEAQTRTQNWNQGGGTVDTLARDGVLELLWRDPDIRRTMVPDTYAISEIAWHHLNTHPELLDLEKT